MGVKINIEKSDSKNVALIFAGGHGRRMNAGGTPKQFLELKGKPIIVYTLELFQKHPLIDGIIIGCLEEYIPKMQELCTRYGLTKVATIVPGGVTGQDTIYNTLSAAASLYPEDSVVLIHDGVRPLIKEQTITDNIEGVRECGSCITCVPTIETFIINKPDGLLDIPERKDSLIARAPQSFVLRDILDAHRKALCEGRHDFIDSCSMMNYYGFKLHTVMGPVENIKITTPMDYFVFRTMVEVDETKQVFGL